MPAFVGVKWKEKELERVVHTAERRKSAKNKVTFVTASWKVGSRMTTKSINIRNMKAWPVLPLGPDERVETVGR